MPDQPSRRDVLRLLTSLGVGAALASCAPKTGPKTQPSEAALQPLHKTPPAGSPNIIMILVDDLGDHELSCRGNSFNQTPHIDALAEGGMTFTQAYAAAPVCSPTRAALMTGLAPVRTGITDFLKEHDEKYLDPNHLTLNEALKSAGYATGMVGKWHLTGDYDKKRGEPSQHSWDEVHLAESRYIAHGDYFAPYDFMPEVRVRRGKYLTDALHKEAVSFIERRQDAPFFLYLSHYGVHTLLEGKPDKVRKYRRKRGAKKHKPELAAMLESIDEGVGQIMQTLRTTGLSENTLVVFTSDNGGDHLSMSPSTERGAKSHLYEAGIRVPLIAHWPAQIAAGTRNATCTTTMDFYPTFTEIAAATNVPRPLDGESLRPLFRGETLERNALYWHYPRSHPHPDGGRSSGAIRKDDYKLVEFFDTGEVELYDLEADSGETRNLASIQPEKVLELRAQLNGWRAGVGAALATT